MKMVLFPVNKLNPVCNFLKVFFFSYSRHKEICAGTSQKNILDWILVKRSKFNKWVVQ